MFERYTEAARRTIFFARFEASQYGSAFIETEHLLLGLLREDPELTTRFLGARDAAEAIRSQINAHTPPRQAVSTSVDLPLSQSSKRVLAYASEEAERLNHRHIGTGHLTLGLLCEDESFAAQLLRQRGLSLDSVREHVKHGIARGLTSPTARLDKALDDHQSRGVIHVAKYAPVGRGTTHFAVHASEPPQQNEEIAESYRRLRAIVSEMERAIATHEFEQARFYSEQEREERAKLRSLQEQYHLQATPPAVPPLCIDIITDDRFSDVQERCDDYISAGVAEVWLLHPERRRAYTVTQPEGLREFKGMALQSAVLPLVLDLRTLFAD